MAQSVNGSTCGVEVLPPTFEHHHDGFGVQYSRPRLSWRFRSLSADIHDWKQTAYEIEVRRDEADQSQLFTVETADSVLVPWPSTESLESRARRLVRVRCRGRHVQSGQQIDGSWTEWSGWSRLEVALLDNSDWKAQMITISEPWPLGDDGSARPLCFHKKLQIPSDRGPIERARLYITSHGVYTAQINGRQVGDHCLSPGTQSYHKRLHYQMFDVEHILPASGPITIEIEVAAGWFASSWSWLAKRFIYGDKLGVLAQVEVYFKDSSTPLTFCTDNTWQAMPSSTVSSELYNGEVYDQRLNARDETSKETTQFVVQQSPIAVSKLVSPEAAPVRVIERIQPNEIFPTRGGAAIIVDFGQNFAGRVSVHNVRKPSGTAIMFRHAEVVQDGEIVQRALRTAKAADVLICDGSKIVEWHPKYTFHGFRYVEISGWTAYDVEGPFTRSSIVAEVLHTDMSRTGWFSCSDEDVTRLHENSLWGMRSNFLSVPMECPSRDERLGWTGDLNMFAPTANFLYDTAGILRNWLDDLYLDQMEDSSYWRRGVVPLFSPNCLLRTGDNDQGWDPMPNGVWSDAAVMVPWEVFNTFGDVEVLARQYDSMVQYLEHGVTRDHDRLWHPEQWQFGDWLDPRAPQNDSGRGTTDGTYVADCFLIASTRIVAAVAILLAKPDDMSRYEEEAIRLERAWQSKYLTGTGLVAPDTATALSLALSFDLIPHAMRTQAVSRLSRIVRLNDFKISTGFVGSAYLPNALVGAGKVELAYGMLFQRGYPSYLYPVTMGATTTWERWDSMLPNGSVNAGSMTSFNHHALGSIAHWLHTDVGGLAPIEPGWKVFRLRPRPNKELTWAETIFESTYGRIELRWTLHGEEFCMDLCVPPNSSALVILPGKIETDEGGASNETEQRVVGSGHFHFRCRFVQTDWPPKALLPPWGRAEF